MAYIVTDDGNWVNQKFEDLARILQEYDPNLELGWIPPDKRTTDEKYPFAILENRDGKKYIVTYVSESQEPYQVLGHIISIDNRNEIIINRLEAEDAARKLLDQQKFNDSLAEGHEKATFLIASPLHYLTMGRDKEGKLIRLDGSLRRLE